jgi:peptide/nickel transport system permease protein
MLWYALRRLLLAVPILVGITFVSFLVIHLAPGDPVGGQLGDLNPEVSPQVRQMLQELYGLDQPLHVQYGLWLKRILGLDFGRSFAQDGRPVLDKIAERLPVTLLLNLVEMVIILAMAIPIGVLSATRQYSGFDKITTVFVFIGFATPDFWLALLLMILFGVQLGWLPISGLRSLNWEYLSFWRQQWDFLSHLILPITVATFGGLAGFSRYMRQSMLEVVRQDYIQTARAKGLAERLVIGKHALRNAMLPIVTVLGLSLPGLIGGSVIVESIFAIPGMGQLMVQAVFERDYPVIMGNLVIVSALTLAANLVADLSYGLVDPRIRLAGRGGRRRGS